MVNGFKQVCLSVCPSFCLPIYVFQLPILQFFVDYKNSVMRMSASEQGVFVIHKAHTMLYLREMRDEGGSGEGGQGSGERRERWEGEMRKGRGGRRGKKRGRDRTYCRSICHFPRV